MQLHNVNLWMKIFSSPLSVQYYTENGAKPVYVLLLDASKAFDKVAFNVLFNELRDRPLTYRLTYRSSTDR